LGKGEEEGSDCNIFKKNAKFSAARAQIVRDWTEEKRRKQNEGLFVRDGVSLGSVLAALCCAVTLRWTRGDCLCEFFFPTFRFPGSRRKKERGRRKRRRRRCRWNQSIGRCRSRVLLHLISLTRTFNSSRSPPIQTGLHARRRGRRRPLPAGAGPERDVSVFPSLIFLFVRFPLCNEGH
jgi:hypothetical protein